MDTQTPSLTPGGEFRDPALEAEYRAAHLPERLRQAHLAFLWATVLNVLFYASDWTSFEGADLPVALAARSVIVLASLACLAAASRVRSHRALQIVCLAWSAAAAPACAVLLAPHTEAALFMLFVLPIIFPLILPLAFGPALGASLVCNAVILAGFLSGRPPESWDPALGLGLLTEITLMLLFLARGGRLQRQEWAARRDAARANSELDASRRTLQALLQAVPAPLLILGRGGAIAQANAAARDYFGEPALADAATLRQCFSPEDFTRITAPAARGRAGGFEAQVQLPDGAVRDVLLQTCSVETGDAAHCLAVCMDITQLKEIEARLALLANTDPLTGLANRHRFFDVAAAEIKRAQRHGSPPALVMLDLDHFKRVNDTLGHEAGDTALRRVAALCRTLLRSQDLACRLGGEEFVLLLPETDAAGGLALAERLRRAVAGLHLDGHALPLTVSVGVGVVRPEEPSVSPGLARADQAMYAAKRAGRNRTVLWDRGISGGDGD